MGLINNCGKKRGKRKLYEKSQAEIMGILVVVLLLSLGMFLVAQFMINKGNSQEKQEFSRQQAAANSLTAMLKITTECKGLSVTELYQDCAHNQPDGSIICGTGIPAVKSCSYVKSTVGEILKDTFSEQNLNLHYYYTVQQGDKEDMLQELKDSQYDKVCKQVSSKQSPIPLTPGFLIVELSVC